MTEVRFGSKFIQPVVLALGFFDCVHKGHAALLAEAGKLASHLDALPAALTFADGGEYFSLSGKQSIYPYTDRVRRLGEEGAKVVVYAHFDKRFRSLSARSFLRKLTGAYYVVGIVTGPDFSFGRGAKGSIRTLQRYCRRKKIEFKVVEELQIGGERVSSSAIRELLKEGDVTRANALLGAPYRLTGTVERGRAIGGTLGVRTANIPVPDSLVRLKEGVYATLINVDGGIYPSVTSYGTQPTVGGTTFRSETHIIGRSLDIYGKAVTVQFIAHLRNMEKFADVAEMKVQIEKDIINAKSLLMGDRKPEV